MRPCRVGIQGLFGESAAPRPTQCYRRHQAAVNDIRRDALDVEEFLISLIPSLNDRTQKRCKLSTGSNITKQTLFNPNLLKTEVEWEDDADIHQGVNQIVRV